MEPAMVRTINAAERRARAEATARRMRAEQFDRLIVIPLARALAFIRRLPETPASRAQAPHIPPCD